MSEENVELVRASIEAYRTGARDSYVDDIFQRTSRCALTPPVSPSQSLFGVALSSGGSSPSSTRAGRVAPVREIRNSFPLATGSWLASIGEAGAEPAVSTFTPA